MKRARFWGRNLISRLKKEKKNSARRKINFPPLIPPFFFFCFVLFTVQRAKGLLIKGKGGTNNCFVIIALGKEKYQTSIKQKAPDSVMWNEECEL